MARTINALTPFYGSKRQAADDIVEALGPHHSYYALFVGGSFAVEMAKPPSRMEVVNDLHGGVVNLALVVQDDDLSVRLFEKLKRTAFCEEIYERSVDWLHNHETLEEKGFSSPPPDPLWAYHYFVMSWMGRNGFVGTERELSTGFCKRFTSKGGDPATRFRNAVEQLPRFWGRFQNFTILRGDGLALADKVEDADGVVVYADAPYVVKGAKYRHDFTEDDHRVLGKKLSRFSKTRVVVSYYNHPLVDELYVSNGWHKKFLDVQKNLSVTAESGPTKAPEVLLCNRPF